jgi:hypothetical protein
VNRVKFHESAGQECEIGWIFLKGRLSPGQRAGYDNRRFSLSYPTFHPSPKPIRHFRPARRLAVLGAEPEKPVFMFKDKRIESRI